MFVKGCGKTKCKGPSRIVIIHSSPLHFQLVKITSGNMVISLWFITYSWDRDFMVALGRNVTLSN